MIPLPLLALAVLFPAESTVPAVDPIEAMIRAMPPPDWMQKELRGAPPTTMAPTGTTIYAAPPPRQPTSYIQGLLGITELHVKNLDLESGSGTFQSQDDATMPLIGGAVQRMLGGNKLRYGLEGGFLLGWMGNVQAVVIGSGGAAIAAENDVFLTEFFGGLAADLPLGDKLRVYAGAGGLVDWAMVDMTFNDSGLGYVDVNGSGWGLGLYTRLGFDILVQSGMRVGFCWRWFETDLDLGSGIPDLELDGMQYMLTFSRSM